MLCPEPKIFEELVAGRLTSAPLRDFERHVAECRDCAEVAAELARLASPGTAPAPWLSVGDRVGRYEIREWLGSGGMGQVFAATDPQLGRSVALKLPRSTGDTPTSRRLLREAKAMAQLSHANVVAVHDAGLSDGRPFIAMELVVGTNLAEWVTSERSWREIVAAYVDAGRGLAAAHRAGLLHRDFKPANALIAEDGRVLVTDFGLATGEAIGPDSIALAQPLTAEAGDVLVSVTGELVGTPGYMAPEVLDGEAATEQSDQFSFATSLVEALGKRPVPRSVTRAIARALAADSSERWPSLDEFLGSLHRGLNARRRLAVAVAAAAAAGLIVFGGWWLLREPEPRLAELCGDPAAEVARHWQDDRKAVVRSAFAAIDRPYAADNHKRVERALDRYADGWIASRDQACHETYVEKSQSPELFEERRACLDSHLASFASLVERLDGVEANTLDRFAILSHQLPQASECSRTGVLARVSAKPPAAIAAEVQRTRRDLRAARIDGELGTNAAAIALFEPLVARAIELDYRPLVADTHIHLARRQREGQKFGAARASATRALAAAQAAEYRVGTALANIELALISIKDPNSTADERKRWSDLARASVEPVAEHGGLAAEVASLDALLAQRSGDMRAQLAAFERQLEIKRAAYGDDSPSMAGTMNDLATTHARLGDAARAAKLTEPARRILEEAYGRHHPLAMLARSNLAVYYARTGRFEQAAELMQEQVELTARVRGAQSEEAAHARQNLAGLQEMRGNIKAALAESQAAHDTLATLLDDNHPDLANAKLTLGGLLIASGRAAEAIDLIRTAIATLEATRGPDHPSVAIGLANLGEAASAIGQPREAIKAYLRAYEIYGRRLSLDHPQAVMTLYSIGRQRIMSGEARRGIRDLLGARKNIDKVSNGSRAMIEIALANAMHEHRGDNKAARKHALAARSYLASNPESVAKIDKFLAKL